MFPVPLPIKQPQSVKFPHNSWQDICFINCFPLLLLFFQPYCWFWHLLFFICQQHLFPRTLIYIIKAVFFFFDEVADNFFCDDGSANAVQQRSSEDFCTISSVSADLQSVHLCAKQTSSVSWQFSCFPRSHLDIHSSFHLPVDIS